MQQELKLPHLYLGSFVFQVHVRTKITYISEASLSGRVKEAQAKGLLAKQLQGLNTDVAFLNEANGTIKCKKAKKEKSPEEEQMAEMKKLYKKTFVSIYDI